MIKFFYVRNDLLPDITLWCVQQFGPMGCGTWGRSRTDKTLPYMFEDWKFWFLNDEDAVLFKMTWELS